jgi:DNA relaxase NicK
MSLAERSPHPRLGGDPSEDTHRRGGGRSDKLARSGKPPSSNTGVEITVHHLRGTFGQSVDEILELVNTVSPSSYIETRDYGRNFFYKRHHLFEYGMRLYFEPSQENMPPCLLECPGKACEAIGYESLQMLYCNANLTRCDVAFDGAPFSPGQAAQWIRDGNIRTRAKRGKFLEELLGSGDGETVYIGSRESERLVRVYDRRGFTRVELELKGKSANAFKDVLLDSENFVTQSVGILREYLDFIDVSKDSNVSRAPLLDVWKEFTMNLERFKLQLEGKAVQTLDEVQDWLEHQVSAMLATFARAGGSVGQLIKIGRTKMSKRHRDLLRHNGVAIL